MTHYLVEFRFQGKAKAEIRKKIYALDKKFNLGFARSKRPIPHISLVGPFTTNQEKKLIEDFYSICSSTPFCSFKVNGYGFFEDKGVIYIHIDPSEKLKSFRWELSKITSSYCDLKDHDYDQDFIFHATLALKLSGREFRAIKQHIEQSENLKFKHFLIRATLIKNQKILCEYDFLQRKLLTRSEALDRGLNKRTKELLDNFFIGNYNPDEHIEVRESEENRNDDHHRRGLISIIKEFAHNILYSRNQLKKAKIFLISDTHFDHENIIRYCQRPFADTREMNQFLINKWNSVVKKNDTVFFLGDMTFGWDHEPIDYWLKKLNGNVIFINGSHDYEYEHDSQEYAILNYRDKEFYLIHDPDDVPGDWDGWVIHGHHHNHKMNEFPFINGENKTINVSVELINYTPLNIDELFSMDFENIEYKEKLGNI